MNVLLIGGPKDIDGRIVEARDDYPYIEMYEQPPANAGFLLEEEDTKPAYFKTYTYVVEPFIVFDRVTGMTEDFYIGVLDGTSAIEAVHKLFWSYNDTKSKEAIRERFSR